MNLPELRRARAEWLTRPRLVIGAVAVTGAAIAKLAFSGGQSLGHELTEFVILLQSAILFLYGVPALVRDFSEEHEKNTWDLLRLTPLSAGEIVLGKAAAATSYAVYLAALLAPWALLAQPLDRAPSLFLLAGTWAWLALSLCATALTAVAAAAVGARLQGGRLGVAGLALGALGLGVFSLGINEFERAPRLILGGFVPGSLWYLASGALCLFWSAVGARVEVGKLLSQRGPRWALPGFIATVWGYCLLLRPAFAAGGETQAASAACLVAPALAAVLASFTEPERPAAWSARRLPSWAPSWLAVAAVSSVSALVLPDGGRLALLVPLFLARDLLLVSYTRVIATRAPEAWAMGALGVLYVIPAFFMLAARDASGMHWLLPIPVPGVSFLANILPAFLHAAAAGILVWAGLRERKKGYAFAAPESEPAA